MEHTTNFANRERHERHCSFLQRWSLRQLAAAAAVLTLLCACAGVQTPVIPTLAPDLSVSPTPTRVTASGMNATSTASTSIVVDKQGFADSAFRTLWQQIDGPIAAGTTTRSWYWGQPVPFGAVEEPYAESPGGQRLVQYFEKGRMEINDPTADPTQSWYVTSGLLTVELVSGRVQVGVNEFASHAPAEIPVTGDLDSPDPSTPLYADYTAERLGTAPSMIGDDVTTKIAHDASDTEVTPPVQVKIASYDDALGHNIPDVFADYFDHDLATLGMNWLYVMGHPISEPYWVGASFGGSSHVVLVQLFERRALSFDPTMPTGQQVQFTNIGLHYYRWRYHDQTSQFSRTPLARVRRATFPTPARRPV